MAGRVVHEDVGLDEDLPLRGRDCREHRGERGVPGEVDLNGITGMERAVVNLPEKAPERRVAQAPDQRFSAAAHTIGAKFRRETALRKGPRNRQPTPPPDAPAGARALCWSSHVAERHVLFKWGIYGEGLFGAGIVATLVHSLVDPPRAGAFL